MLKIGKRFLKKKSYILLNQNQLLILSKSKINFILTINDSIDNLFYFMLDYNFIFTVCELIIYGQDFKNISKYYTQFKWSNYRFNLNI